MNTERMCKSAFCERELTALLKAVDSDIEKAEYELCDNGEEYVHILYATTGGVTTACVTADSLLALARDVLKKLD